MSSGNTYVEHCGIVAVQSKKTNVIVLYIDHKRVMKITADCRFKPKDLVRLIDRHKSYIRGKGH